MPVTASTEPGLLRAGAGCSGLPLSTSLYCQPPGPAIDRAAYKATITMLTTDA
ncbi:hypothetical protein ACIOHO_12380 [Streptomyces sp. NPDC087849]|uniref:hypothetical protein n=1 Tax=Streptomyces sp. NPDC087849 TaxID=3365808 RepID=UPI0037F73143